MVHAVTSPIPLIARSAATTASPSVASRSLASTFLIRSRKPLSWSR